MIGRPIGGTVFALGLAALCFLVAYHYVIRPIICGITANCGGASW